MRRVCCLLERWESGGIESFLYNVLTQIDLTQLQVDIIVSSLGESIFTRPLQKLGICFFELSGSQRNVVENHRRFRLLMQERHWDVLHLHAFQGLSLYYLHLAKEAGIPVRIAHSHNTTLRKSLTRPLKLAVHACARERYTRDATVLWACSQDAAEFLFSARTLKQKKFQFIPNGIDTGRFRFDPTVRDTVRAELGLTDQFVIGNVGRLCCQKNQEFLLDVFAEVLKRNRDSRLLLAGEGADNPALRKKARRLGVAEKVIFYGNANQVERLLWAMDVFAFPSLFEGLGIAAVEAQAAGLYVLCSEHIPNEAYVTPRAQMLPLKSGSVFWADRVAAIKACQGDIMRDSAACEVRRAGFDIKDVIQIIEQKYGVFGSQTS